MSTTNCETLRKVIKGRTDWKVKVRIIREWRGVSLTGEVFKGWNLLLLDAKKCRMQAFVPASMAQRMARLIEVGKLYLVKNFEVKDYLDKDKFRPVQIDRQIIFTVDTKVKELDESEIFIPQNTFDFYEFGDLLNMCKQYLYLVDVVGVVQRNDKVAVKQSQQGKSFIKFKISDGCKKINVTFWNTMATEFESAIEDVSEEPVIIIIASGRVSKWHDEIDICNYSPTKFFLNYEHHSVAQLRKMLKEPNFSMGQFSSKKKTYTHCTMEVVTSLGPEFIQDEIIVKGTLNYVDESKNWNIWVCTSCFKQVDMENKKFSCKRCQREVPYPNKRFKVSASISDPTGRIEITLLDREVRTILGKNAFNVQKQDDSFPPIIKSLQARDYTLKIPITEENILGTQKIYEVNGIFEGWNMKQEILNEQVSDPQLTTSTTQVSGTSYHLDDISQLNNDK